MMAVGIIAILLISGYLIFSFNEKSNLDQLNASLDNDVMNESIAVTIDEQDSSRLSDIDLPKHFSNMHFGVLFHPKYWHDGIFYYSKYIWRVKLSSLSK